MKVQDQFKTIQMIFFALLAGQIIFLFIAVYLVQIGNMVVNDNLFLPLFVTDLLIISPAVVLGPMLYRGIINRAKPDSTINDKINLYRQGLIIKLALVEAPTIFSIVGYLLTGSVIFLLIASAVLILFFFHKPSVEKFADEFRISISELE